MKPFMNRQFMEGIFLLCLGSAILILVPFQVIAVRGMEANLSPSFIPRITGMGIVLTGLIVSISAAWARKRGKDAVFKAGEFPRVLLSALYLLAYAFLFPMLGFVSTSFLFIGILSFQFGQRNPLKLAALMIFIPVSVWILFELVFVIPLPHGLLY